MSERPKRAYAQRHRSTILEAAAAELRSGRRLEVQRVAATAGVSRSTVHRHFANVAGVERALCERALAVVAAAGERTATRASAPLADARSVITTLAEVADRFGLAAADAQVLVEASRAFALSLLPLARRLLDAADMDGPDGPCVADA